MPNAPQRQTHRPGCQQSSQQWDSSGSSSPSDWRSQHRPPPRGSAGTHMAIKGQTIIWKGIGNSNGLGPQCEQHYHFPAAPWRHTLDYHLQFLCCNLCYLCTEWLLSHAICLLHMGILKLHTSQRKSKELVWSLKFGSWLPSFPTTW